MNGVALVAVVVTAISLEQGSQSQAQPAHWHTCLTILVLQKLKSPAIMS